MKIQNLKAVIFVALLLTFSCTDKLSVDKDLLYADFQQHLLPDMTLQLIENVFGKPHKDIGSGIHIYVYILADKTEVWIGYSNKILYARHLNSSNQLLHTII